MTKKQFFDELKITAVIIAIVVGIILGCLALGSLTNLFTP